MHLSDSVIITLIATVFFIFVLVLFKNKIRQASRVRIGLREIIIEAPGQEFANLYERMYSKLLKESHIKFYKDLMKKNSLPTVIEMIPGFNRELKEWYSSDKGKHAIGMLRALRGLGFIEPEGGGEWQKETKIRITEFGKEMKKFMSIMD